MIDYDQLWGHLPAIFSASDSLREEMLVQTQALRCSQGKHSKIGQVTHADYYGTRKINEY